MPSNRVSGATGWPVAGSTASFPASTRESAYQRLRDSLEEFGLTETTRLLRTNPEQLGLKGKKGPEVVSQLEPACRELLEARDALDLTIANSP
jgi:hypothetical protein